MTVTQGFELIKEVEIEELNTHGRLFRHVKTGAELLSLENNDENKVFGITFRTPPEDSTGLPHIMEHSVLCGSEKYPIKEPFVELIKGSLKTFLNAFTYPDKTCYPVASQNVQDFYNLIDVYVDAVFHPLISPFTLQQEGWHYELDDSASPLTYKGVVFNEMKGAYSSPDNVLARFTQQSLFPDTPYGVDSGGDPQVIPDLTYERFKRFHDTYYHPSNARIYFYGDDDPEERLRLMDGYLQDFESLEVDSGIDLQKRFSEPKQVVIPYDAGEASEDKKGFLTVNWLFPETLDPELTLSLHILAHILIGTPASPLRKALIDSGLGEDLAGQGLEGELRQMFFSTGLKGIAVEDADRVQALILETLKDLAESGFETEMIEASLNTTEFRLRENNTGSFPRGLSLMLRSLTTWLYDGDPFAPLAFEEPLANIKAHVNNNGRYFETLVQKYLLDNQHRTTLLLKPDPGLGERQDAAERSRLEKVRQSLSQQQLEQIVENTQELQRRQQAPDDPQALETIPSLELEDLERENKIIPLEISSQDGTQILYHDLFTNGIAYLDVGFNLHSLPDDYLPYVPLFGKALLGLGTETQDFVKLSQRIGRSTGGIYPTSFTSVIEGGDQAAAWLFLRAKAISRQSEEMLAILKDVLLTARLDNRERFRQIVLEQKANLEAMLVPAGHRVVNTRLRALFNEADWADEQMSGVEYLYFLRQLVEDVERDWAAVLNKLEAIRKVLLDRQNMLCNVTLDDENWQAFQPQLNAFLEALPSGPGKTVAWNPRYATDFQGLSIPAQVNYVGKGANLYKLGYQPKGSIAVILNYLRMSWLWERVRVQGGAYGGFCTFDHRSGVFTFLSYRDPNLLLTLENYDGASEFLRQLDLSREELTKSIIGAIGDMDAYQLPDAKGYTSMLRYLAGDSDEARQRRREEILAASKEDFREFAGILKRLNDAGRVVVMGSQQAIQEANQARDGWLKVQKVL
jgi:Zn-dependent M16 (insulinase) family peptidase